MHKPRFCVDCGYHRKHAVRLLNSAESEKEGGAIAALPEVVGLLKEFWLASDQTSVRLQLRGQIRNSRVEEEWNKHESEYPEAS